jgi:hypothetical protein
MTQVLLFEISSAVRLRTAKKKRYLCEFYAKKRIKDNATGIF